MSNPPNSAAVEAMARAIYEARNGPGATKWMHLPRSYQKAYLLDAQAALTALCALHPGVGAIIEGGAVAVPRGASDIRSSEICQCGACSAEVQHASDCAVHNEPAMRNGPCDCGASPYAPPPSPAAAEGV